MAYKSNLRKVKSEMQNKKEIALEKIGIMVRGEAQLRSPVVTGAYRDSHDYQVEKDSVIVGNSVEHSIYVELGSSRMRGQHVIENSVMENARKINQIVSQEYKRLGK